MAGRQENKRVSMLTAAANVRSETLSSIRRAPVRDRMHVMDFRIQRRSAANTTADSISATRIMLALLVLFWHERWRQRTKADALIFTVLETAIKRAASRRIAAAGGRDGGRCHQTYGFLCHSAFTGSEIGRAAALRPAIRAGGDGSFGLFRQLGVIGQPVGAWDAARSIIFAERLDPKMDGARLAFERMRFDDASLQQFETRRQRITR